MTDAETILAPESLESEVAVLAALMADNRTLAQVADWLSAEDFASAAHRLLFGIVAELVARGLPADAVTIGEHLGAQGVDPETLAMRDVLRIANSSYSTANVAAYAEIVREKSRLRKAMDVGATLVREASTARGRQAADLIGEAARTLLAMGGDTRGLGPVGADAAVKSWYADLTKRYEAGERMSGLATGWTDLDEVTDGWQPGDLIIVAGRPSMGKSVMGFQTALHSGMHGRRAMLCSLEMRTDQVVRRMVACVGRVGHTGLRKPHTMDESAWPRVTFGVSEVRAAALVIDDHAALAPAQIVARARREHMRSPLHLVVIDHLHEMKFPGRDRVNEIGDGVRELKALGKEIGCPVILLAQLNRANTARTNQRPTMADLRASGSIEEAADVILLLHREDYYVPDTHMRGIVEVVLAKGRDLPAGDTIYLQNRFDELRLEDRTEPVPFPTERTARGRRPIRGNPHADKGEQ